MAYSSSLIIEKARHLSRHEHSSRRRTNPAVRPTSSGGLRILRLEAHTMISRTQNSHTVPQSVGWSWRHPATDIKQDAATTELQQENSLRWPIDLATEPGILVSRWTDSRSFYRCEHIETPSHFHIISVAMRAVVVKLSGPEGIL